MIVVTRMTDEDAPTAVRLLQELDSKHGTDDWLERFARDVADPDRHPVVARLDGTLVGYARTLPYVPTDEDPPGHAPAGYYLLGLVVTPGARRQGVATALTAARLQWITARADAAYFYTDHDNVASQRMHEALGFRRISKSFWFPAMGDSKGEVLYGKQLAVAPA